MEIIDKIDLENVLKISIHFKTKEIKKIIISLINNDYYLIETLKENKVFHKNILKNDLKMELSNYKEIKNLTVFYIDSIEEFKISKKNKIFFHKVKKDNKKLINLSHNKEKNYILSKIKTPILKELGILGEDYKIINAKYDKFKQINRFLEIINDEIKYFDFKDNINIIDFGCGKSYLSFIIYDYFTKILKYNVNLIGFDLKKDVIDNCNQLAKKYHYKNLSFQCEDISKYKSDRKIDIIIGLHVCDIATDYALFNAIRLDAKMIFFVPCCHNEVYKQFNTKKLSILNEYNIVKERISSIFTDVIRSNLLKVCEYKVDMLEFVDFSNSPKNLMIRAKKNNAIKMINRKKALIEVLDLINEFNLNPKLYDLLYKANYFDNFI